MELLNTTGMQAGYTLGMQPDGRELLVVAVKGTFTIPERREEPRLAEEQVPLVEADTFTGEPGLSAPVHEVDYAPVKRRCDVLLNGSAYAPGGKPTARVEVGLKVGSMVKTFAVVGDRYWEAGKLSVGPGYSGQFTVMPISYDRAFGGVDNFHPDESKHSAYMQNPVGKGYHYRLNGSLVNGTPMPNTEERNRRVTRPDGNYRPMSFGPIGRGWEPRYKLAGTYDQDWLNNVFPFLPADFDERYYQCAPADQQIEYPKGGEEVILVNLTPSGRRAFTLPHFEMPVCVFPKKAKHEDLKANLDTIVIEPDQDRLTITWRVARPLKRHLFEISQVLVSRPDQQRWQQSEEIAFSVPSVGAAPSGK